MALQALAIDQVSDPRSQAYMLIRAMTPPMIATMRNHERRHNGGWGLGGGG